jgi:hypothetical protein
MHTVYNIVAATFLSSHLSTVVSDQIVTMQFNGKQEQFRVFSITPCSAGASTLDMERRGWEPVMYGCERVISGRKRAKAVVLAYRSLRTGDFEIAVRC